MGNNKYSTLLVISLIISSFLPLLSQEIKGDTIYSSTSQLTSLFFPGKIISCDYAEAEAYTRFTKRVEESMVTIIAKAKDVKSSILKVTEGKRNHWFIIVFKQELSHTELEHDWSTIKKLSEHLDEINRKIATTGKSLDEIPQNGFVKNPGPVVPTAPGFDKKIVLNDTYDDILINALTLFKARMFKESRALYVHATSLNPGETIAAGMIKEIDNILGGEQKEADYKIKIQTANTLYNGGKYEDAKSLYSAALTLKPNDLYATTQLNECKKKIDSEITLKRNQETEKVYQKSIEAGESAMKGNRLEEAKDALLLAAKLKPYEVLPKKYLAELDKKLKENKIKTEKEAKELAFNTALIEGNNAYNGRDFKTAWLEYTKAFEIKADPYILGQMKNIGKILADSSRRITEEKLKADQYAKYVKAGDKAYEQKDFTTANRSYLQALNFKEDPHTKAKIAEIEDILRQRAAETENNRKYAVALVKGKNAVKLNDFDNARIFFKEADDLKPGEPYPKEQLVFVNQKLLDIAKEKELNEKYDTVISKASFAFEAKAYNRSLTLFKEAGELKPGDPYPTKMIFHIEGLLLGMTETAKREENAAKRRRSSEVRENAIKAISEKNWEAALAGFKEILTLNPSNVDEDFATLKIKAITLELEKKAPQTVKAPPVKIIPKNKREARALKKEAEHNSVVAQASDKKTNESLPAKTVNTPAKVNEDKPDNIPAKTAAGSFQAEAIPYTREILVNKYPDIKFDELPPGQTLDASDRKNRSRNFELSNKLLEREPVLSISDSIKNIKLTCDGIAFNEPNVYLRLTIKNTNISNDFLAGVIQMKIIGKNGSLKDLNQRFISDFPVVMPKNEFKLIYVADASYNLDPEDKLIVVMNDRLNNLQLKLTIPGFVYNQQKTNRL